MPNEEVVVQISILWHYNWWGCDWLEC